MKMCTKNQLEEQRTMMYECLSVVNQLSVHHLFGEEEARPTESMDWLA
jgi:hypothetical protein